MTPLMARCLAQPSQLEDAKDRRTQGGGPKGPQTSGLGCKSTASASYSHPIDSQGWAGPKMSRELTEELTEDSFSSLPNSCSECAVGQPG